MFESESLVYLDKVTLYLCVFYPPFVLSYLLLQFFLAQRFSFAVPAILVYSSLGLWLFATDQYWARGMDVPSKPFYFAILFLPSVLALALLPLRRKVVNQVVSGSAQDGNAEPPRPVTKEILG